MNAEIIIAVGARVYWRSLYDAVCSGTVQGYRGFRRFRHNPLWYLVLPDGCEFALWLRADALVTLPEYLKVSSGEA